MTHKVKIWPEFYLEVLMGRLKFQIRKNDRDYQAGHLLLLQEWSPEVAGNVGYTGRELLVTITYVMTPRQVSQFAGDGILADDYVILGIGI